jgi:hypothetical protein
LAACYEWLAVSSDIDIIAAGRRLIEEAGVTEAWWPLVDVLEPLKWYGRLLGEQALSARIAGSEMPQARPYDADTPLNRVVDGLPPESFTARAVAALCRRQLAGDAAAAAQLLHYGHAWRALAEHPGCLPELAGSARLLGAGGTMLIGVLEGSVDSESAVQTLAAAAEPQGEYLLAVVPVLRAWVEAAAR